MVSHKMRSYNFITTLVRIHRWGATRERMWICLSLLASWLFQVQGTFPLNISNDCSNSQGCWLSQIGSTTFLREGEVFKSPLWRERGCEFTSYFIPLKLIKQATDPLHFALNIHLVGISQLECWEVTTGKCSFQFQSDKTDVSFVNMIYISHNTKISDTWKSDRVSIPDSIKCIIRYLYISAKF